MTDFDMIFDRLRGLTWSHVAMAACCFVLGAVQEVGWYTYPRENRGSGPLGREGHD